MSLAWLRKDRRTTRLIPFFRLGDRVLYNLDRVLETFFSLEEGGVPKARGRRRGSPRAGGAVATGCVQGACTDPALKPSA